MTQDGSPDSGSLGLLRGAAAIAAVVGAVGAVALMLSVPQHRIPFLMVLFTIWVGAPFVVLIWAIIRSRTWSVSTRGTVYIVTLLITLATVAIYGRVVVSPPKAQPAFWFVITPVLSCLVLAAAVSMSVLTSRRRSRLNEP